MYKSFYGSLRGRVASVSAIVALLAFAVSSATAHVQPSAETSQFNAAGSSQTSDFVQPDTSGPDEIESDDQGEDTNDQSDEDQQGEDTNDQSEEDQQDSAETDSPDSEQPDGSETDSPDSNSSDSSSSD